MSGDRQQLVDDYLDALLRRDDISPYFTPDVLWRTMETEADFVGGTPQSSPGSRPPVRTSMSPTA